MNYRNRLDSMESETEKFYLEEWNKWINSAKMQNVLKFINKTSDDFYPYK